MDEFHPCIVKSFPYDVKGKTINIKPNITSQKYVQVFMSQEEGECETSIKQTLKLKQIVCVFDIITNVHG
jgi:hypothetical protein